ncbi:MAG: L-rhamnose/proton symporter RhaT [Candidatus Hydrogenedentes bacterium]|nr:L-rhamnose/proton symporter RhaT [Candidatus Hydrogenedentota bacterium]
MDANPALGVLLHAIGGLAAASFYIPYKRVRHWQWESYWLVGGIFSWLIAPLLGVALITPAGFGALQDAPVRALIGTYVFGVLWGIGGLTFGLSVRYLGLSLGYAVALGFCAAFGTIIPPLFLGAFAALIETGSGLTTLLGVAVCLGGIGVCGWAGIRRDREAGAQTSSDGAVTFNLLRGLWVAVFAGVMSACMAFAFAAGKPITEAALAAGVGPTFVNLPVLVVALGGGLTTNLIWCLYLNWRNKSFRDYTHAGDAPLLWNYLFSALAGGTWYLQFFFYGMATTRMGAYDFSSWTIHMAFIIAFSNVWGLLFGEWQGTRRQTIVIVSAGIVILVLSTVVVGVGNYLAV